MSYAYQQYEDIKKDILGETKLLRRVQIRIAMNAQPESATDGQLFSHEVLETLEPGGEWTVGAEVKFPGKIALHAGALGSDRRLVIIEELPSDIFAFAQKLEGAFAAGRAV